MNTLKKLFKEYIDLVAAGLGFASVLLAVIILALSMLAVVAVILFAPLIIGIAIPILFDVGGWDAVAIVAAGVLAMPCCWMLFKRFHRWLSKMPKKMETLFHPYDTLIYNLVISFLPWAKRIVP